MKPLKWITLILVMLAVSIPFPGLARNLDLPDVVMLDKLVDLYSAAEFDHEYHTEITDDCTVCHHHTVGIPATDENCARCHNTEDVLEKVACIDCHSTQPFSAEYLEKKEALKDVYHIDKPGLKAAYHLNCLTCHVEAGGPEGCEDCHERTDRGDAFYYSGRYAPNDVEEVKTH
ncbi:MAG: cytochrome c3 family protein [Pseudomonadota bacterium]|jgi:hypothetical protein